MRTSTTSSLHFHHAHQTTLKHAGSSLSESFYEPDGRLGDDSSILTSHLRVQSKTPAIERPISVIRCLALDDSSVSLLPTIAALLSVPPSGILLPALAL